MSPEPSIPPPRDPDIKANAAERDADLATQIVGSTEEAPVRTTLKTDERVLARVTDGIYRQPGSALRELIANAYDADACSVVITTDRPRFGVISIRDDGHGMSPDVVAHLVHHIGGSAKRTSGGIKLGIGSEEDPTVSPGGRKLIGRIGIGLFSVAQLTDRFQIITKTEGDAFRTIATVVLKQFSEMDVSGEGDEFEAGRVNIWRESAVDKESHGTTIVLTDLRTQTRETLRSQNLWLAIDASEDAGQASPPMPPEFHVGHVRRDNEDLFQTNNGDVDALPWSKDDDPRRAFELLVQAVDEEAQSGAVANPKLADILDYYLRMVWLQLGLAVPLPYVHGHPFDIRFGDSVLAYEMPSDPRQAPRAIDLGEQTFREALNLPEGDTEGADFKVLVDDLELSRPLRFQGLPRTSHKIGKPILMVGRCQETFPGVPVENSGGPLGFEAYLMWAPKIVPTEHQGVLIRIHGASGTLFDPDLLRYQVAEQTRRRQTTCEIFVRTGLESALNIDRESFNYSHPHVEYLTRWLHAGLRRLYSEQKRLASTVRAEARERGAIATQERLADIVLSAWLQESDDEGQAPPDVEFASGPSLRGNGDRQGSDHYRFSRDRVLGDTFSSLPKRRRETIEQELVAIVQVLAAHHVLEELNSAALERLVTRLREIIEASQG